MCLWHAIIRMTKHCFYICNLFFILLCLLPGGANRAHAQSELNVRLGIHDEYDRLVIEGNVPAYSVNTTDDGVRVKFNEAVLFQGLTNTSGSIIASIASENEDALFVSVQGLLNLRELKIGNKLILDIYGQKVTDNEQPQDQNPPEPKEKPQTEISEATESSEADEVSVDVIEPSVSEPPSDAGLDAPDSNLVVDEIKEEPAPIQKQLEAVSEKRPHSLIFSSTEAIRMGAYLRFGSLWIVSDRVDLLVPPRINGPNRAIFGALQKYDINDGNGTIWQIKIPDGYSVDVEGGSLFWKFVFRGEDREKRTAPLKLENRTVSAEGKRQKQVVIPMTGDKSVMRIKDHITGEDMDIITVGSANFYTDKEYHYVDFNILESPVGVAVIRKNALLDVTTDSAGGVISSAGQLSVSMPEDVSKNTAHSHSRGARSLSSDRILYHFNEWRMGGVHALEENQRLLMASIRGKSENGKAERLITLAKLNLSHRRGAEALGYLRYASSIIPGLRNSEDFIALRGVSHALARQYDLAIADLFHPGLDQYEEVKLWRTFALAHLGDWGQAIQTLPRTKYNIIDTYPDSIADPLILTLGEVALRNGDIREAEGFLGRLEQKQDELSDVFKNGLAYLGGEKERQAGNIDAALKTWSELGRNYKDDYHRTKAELARVTLALQTGKISLDDAIEALERLRFSWRGDDLEIQVLKRLGLTQIEDGKYLEGFHTLRDTVVLSPNEFLSDELTALMISTYENIFLTDKLQTISPLDAAMLYEEFRELTPSGETGDRLVARLAERLVDADLFERAGRLLAHQIDYRLEGRNKFDTALRLAAIQLMDDKPEDAIRVLNKVETLASREDIGDKAQAAWDISLLRARALSDMGDVSASLNILKNLVPRTIEVIRLEADVAWRAQRWSETADALRDLVMISDISLNEDLTGDHASLLLNYAISLNLAQSRIELSNLRERYLPQMKTTPYGEMFEVITRPRQDAFLANRDQMMNVIGEIEIFQDFLDSYRSTE